MRFFILLYNIQTTRKEELIMANRPIRANDELHLICIQGTQKALVFPDMLDCPVNLFPETSVTFEPRSPEIEIFHNIVPEQKARFVEVLIGDGRRVFGFDLGSNTRLLDDLPVGLWVVVQQIPIYALPQTERSSVYDWQIPALRGNGAILSPWLMPKLSMMKPRRTIFNRSIR